MTWSLSDYIFRYAGIDLELLITSDYRCMKRVTLFSYRVDEYHTTVSHSATQLVLQPFTPKQESGRFLFFNNLFVHHELALHKIYP